MPHLRAQSHLELEVTRIHSFVIPNQAIPPPPPTALLHHLLLPEELLYSGRLLCPNDFGTHRFCSLQHDVINSFPCP